MTNRSLVILLSLSDPQPAIEEIRRVISEAEVRVGPYLDDVGQTMPVDLMRGADILLCEMVPENLSNFDQLRWIQLTSSGYAHITHLPIIEQGITVTNGRGNFDISIAEWNLMMILIWQRQMAEQFRNQQQHTWNRTTAYQQRLHGSTVGFFGYGGLARETARLAKALHMQVWALTREGKVAQRDDIFCEPQAGDPAGSLPDRVFSADEDEAFLTGLDYLVLAMPLNDANQGIVNERVLKLLPKHAVLINPARAPLVPEDVLIQALKENWIRGASFDVHYEYPLSADSPLWSLDNLILTPHIAGHSGTDAFIRNVMSIFTQNLTRFVENKPMMNLLTEAQVTGKA